MAKMCPMDGCKAKKGMCVHDKVMIGMAGILALLAIAHFGFGLFG